MSDLTVRFADDGVRAGRDEAARLGLTNAQFHARDLTSLEAREAYDLITHLEGDIFHAFFIATKA